MLRTIFSDDFTLTKRHLGILLIVASALALTGTLAIELVNSEPVRFGTLQMLGILLSGLSALIGLTLIPLGDRPA